MELANSMARQRRGTVQQLEPRLLMSADLAPVPESLINPDVGLADNVVVLDSASPEADRISPSYAVW